MGQEAHAKKTEKEEKDAEVSTGTDWASLHGQSTLQGASKALVTYYTPMEMERTVGHGWRLWVGQLVLAVEALLREAARECSLQHCAIGRTPLAAGPGHWLSVSYKVANKILLFFPFISLCTPCLYSHQSGPFSSRWCLCASIFPPSEFFLIISKLVLYHLSSS